MSRVIFFLGFIILAGCTNIQRPDTTGSDHGIINLSRAALAQHVRDEYLRAWRGYKSHAIGHDEVLPVTGQPHNWYGKSLLIAPINALDGIQSGRDRHTDHRIRNPQPAYGESAVL